MAARPGGGTHDGGSGEDTLSLTGANFIIQKQGGSGFRIERGSALASNFVDFERFDLGGRTYTAAELTAAVSQAGGRLVLGIDRNPTGTAGNDTLSINNGWYSSAQAGLGDDVLNLSGSGVSGDGGAGNDTFNLSNSRTSWNRVTANGGEGDDTFNVDDSSNQEKTNTLTLNGGSGIDVAKFGRKASEYRLTDVTGTTVTLTHIDSGAITRLTDVEALQFGTRTTYTLADLQGLVSAAKAERGVLSVRLQDTPSAEESGWTLGAPTAEAASGLAAAGMSTRIKIEDNQIFWMAVRLYDPSSDKDTK